MTTTTSKGSMHLLIERIRPGRKYNGPITTDPEWVTPELAAEWLRVNTHNRAINAGKVKGYVEALSNGQWYDATADIAFDTNGVLQNGQHTLTAIAKSGEEALCTVKRNMQPEAQIVTDTGRPRSLGDQLGSGPDSFVNPNIIAAAVKVYPSWLAEGRFRAYEDAVRIGMAPNVVELYKLCRSNKEFLETHASRAAKLAKTIPLLNANNVMVLSIVLEDASNELGQSFIAQLSGDTETCAQPIRKYREGLMRQIDARHPWNRFYRYAYAVKAFNAFAARTDIKKLTIKASEAFPAIEIPEGATA